VTVEGSDNIGTFTGVNTPSLPITINGERKQWTFLAGYEGWQGEACLAKSEDGITWSNLHSRGDHPGGESPDDDDDPWTHTRRCYGESDSFLRRAADAYVMPIVDTVRQRELIWYRQDFGTNYGWREIRGVQAVELDRKLTQIQEDREPFSKTQIQRKAASWYFDRLGKVERFRRHIYAVSLTPYNKHLWLGLMAVLEWAKDTSEEHGADESYFKRDTLSIFLVTSRDGIHLDDEWVYAHRPLVPKDGTAQMDWDSGLMFPGGQILTTDAEHRIYFEARPGNIHHENRFDSIARMGSAAWQRDRIVGLRRAHAAADATAGITTKPFHLSAGSLWLLVDASSACGRVVVEVLRQDGSVVDGRSSADAVPLAGVDGWAEVKWRDSEPLAGTAHAAIALQSVVRLRFNLMGDAALYAFELRPLPASNPSSPAPTDPPSVPSHASPSPSLSPSPSPTSPPSPSPKISPPSPLPSAARDDPRNTRGPPPSPQLISSSPQPSPSPPHHLPSSGPAADPQPVTTGDGSAAESHPATEPAPAVHDHSSAANPVKRLDVEEEQQQGMCSLIELRCSYVLFLLGSTFGCLVGLLLMSKGYALHRGAQTITGAGSRTAGTEEWPDIETELPSRCDDEMDGDREAQRAAKARSKRPITKKRKKGAQDQVRLLDAVTAGLSVEDRAACDTPKGGAAEDGAGVFNGASAQGGELQDQVAPATECESER